MKTETYNKLHVINDELEMLAEFEKKLQIAREQLEGTKKIFNSLSSEVGMTSEVVISVMKDYLMAIQEIRMAFTRETQDILRSAKELRELAKLSPDIDKFVVSFRILKETVDDKKFIKNIKNTFNVSGKDAGEA